MITLDITKTNHAVRDLLDRTEPRKAEIVKLAPAEVLTTQEAGRLHPPYIRPLPSFDEIVAGRGCESTRTRVEALPLEVCE